MKLRIIKNTPVRVSSGLSLHFTAGSEVNVPAKVAEALMAEKAAEPLGKSKPAMNGD